MSETVIKIENLSKEYTLGVISHKTLYRDLQSFTSRLLRKEDPNSQIGTDYSRLRKGKFHALDNISLDIKQGDIVGIIGKNGAGKSTLLKILSRVTGPTSGHVKIKGRVASLLEVGTGFHPELTGRENVFLNGAILGMRKKEIADKFDEIVDFSGVEEFIDTPVKRYSSGMYVRLAFAVAAHLDPEILIVDEVLAVGDAAFQNKCVGRMKNVSNDGKTVLFVSHNMATISSLCKYGIHLSEGKLLTQGNAEEIVRNYLNEDSKYNTFRKWNKADAPGDDTAKLYCVSVISENHDIPFSLFIEREIGIEIEFELFDTVSEPIPQIHVFNQRGECAFISYGHIYEKFDNNMNFEATAGRYKSVVWIPANILNNNLYNISVGLVELRFRKIHFYVENVLNLDVMEDITERDFIYKDQIGGILRPKLKWVTKKIN